MFAAKNILSTTPRMLFDAKGAGTTGSLTNPSWAHTIKGNLLVVGLGTASGSPTAVTVGGKALIKVAATVAFSSGFLSLWYVFNPPTGAQTIAVTNTSSFTAGGSMSYFNALALGSTTSLANTTTAAITMSGLNARQPSISVCAVANSGTTTFSAFSGTSRFNDPYSASINYPFFMGDQAAASSMSITNSTSQGAYIAANFLAA
jgi:hypothetical protein